MFRRLEIFFVWEALINKLKKEDIEWLQKHRKAVWGDFSTRNKLNWARENVRSINTFALRIMEILDAKNDRRELPDFNTLLPKKYLLELARIFDISDVYANIKTPDWKIEEQIMLSIIRKTGYKPL